MKHKINYFEGFGLEIEYAIVNAENFEVMPISDKILKQKSGRYQREVNNGEIGWSNELVMHLLELKNETPTPDVYTLADLFANNVKELNAMLSGFQAKLLPSAMHPFMDPKRDTRIWSHGGREIYQAYHRIFNCHRHGWANVQSTHINLPFTNDEEFAKLHEAIRIILPIIPAIAASSPIQDGILTGLMDTRLHHYENNQSLIPSIGGPIIPNPSSNQAEYIESILIPMYEDISSHDPKKILQHEWLNSRGVIPKFERSSFEIRLMDSQEHPFMDCAISALIIAGVWHFANQALPSIDTAQLQSIFKNCIQYADEAKISDPTYLEIFGLKGPRQGLDLWHALFEKLGNHPLLANPNCKQHINFVLKHGPLARRITKACKTENKATVSEKQLHLICQKLTQCLEANENFDHL